LCWPHGVFSAGYLIKILETLSSGNNENHKRMCAWLIDNYITPFGRVHTLDGLLVQSATDTKFLLLARDMWVEREGWRVKGDVFWVAGLEPTAMADKGDVGQLPLLGKRVVERWSVGAVQYRHGTYLRERKGVLVERCWRDGMGWEREIWDL
jgi:hypothetical protein